MPISLSPQAARLLSAPVRTRKRLFLLCGLILASGVIAFLVHRQRYISENDARVMADMITISSRVDGWVAQRDVTDGDVVTEGSRLVVIDQREALMQVEAVSYTHLDVYKRQVHRSGGHNRQSIQLFSAVEQEVGFNCTSVATCLLYTSKISIAIQKY